MKHIGSTSFRNLPSLYKIIIIHNKSIFNNASPFLYKCFTVTVLHLLKRMLFLFFETAEQMSILLISKPFMQVCGCVCVN